MIYGWLRPILFRIDPEVAHSLVLQLLRAVGTTPVLRSAVRSALSGPRRPVHAFGLDFANPLGLAAGYDKDGLAWRGLACLGLGHLEIGTVTPRPQPGNPRPRVLRIVDRRSIINRLGFPGRGADYVLRRLSLARPPGVVLGVNIGKQKDTPLDRAADDYEQLMDAFAPIADYLAVNISSPNTPELRRLQQQSWLGPLLDRLTRHRDALAAQRGRRVPLLVKLSPDLGDHELDEALGILLSVGLDGVIATNTTVDRTGLPARWSSEQGGLSGAALTRRSTEIVERIHAASAGKLPIVACGGVMSPGDARAKLDAGACLVQLYTGLIYEGPSLVGRILKSL